MNRTCVKWNTFFIRWTFPCKFLKVFGKQKAPSVTFHIGSLWCGRTNGRGGGRVRRRVQVRSRDYQNFGGVDRIPNFFSYGAPLSRAWSSGKYSQIPVRGCLGVFGASIQRPRRIRNWTIKGNKLPTMFLTRKNVRLFNRTKSHSYMSENGYSYHIL